MFVEHYLPPLCILAGVSLEVKDSVSSLQQEVEAYGVHWLHATGEEVEVEHTLRNLCLLVSEPLQLSIHQVEETTLPPTEQRGRVLVKFPGKGHVCLVYNTSCPNQIRVLAIYRVRLDILLSIVQVQAIIHVSLEK